MGVKTKWYLGIESKWYTGVMALWREGVNVGGFSNKANVHWKSFILRSGLVYFILFLGSNTTFLRYFLNQFKKIV
jgi:hypothetical protein